MILYSFIAGIIARVKEGQTPPFRPQINENIEEDWTDLLNSCWEENPKHRLKITQIKINMEKTHFSKRYNEMR